MAHLTSACNCLQTVDSLTSSAGRREKERWGGGRLMGEQAVKVASDAAQEIADETVGRRGGSKGAPAGDRSARALVREAPARCSNSRGAVYGRVRVTGATDIEHGRVSAQESFWRQTLATCHMCGQCNGRNDGGRGESITQVEQRGRTASLKAKGGCCLGLARVGGGLLTRAMAQVHSFNKRARQVPRHSRIELSTGSLSGQFTVYGQAEGI